MDESLQELENELKRLTPRRPSPALRERIERELQRVEPAQFPRASKVSVFPSWKWRGWSLAAAAAAVVVAGVVFVGRPGQGNVPDEIARQNPSTPAQPVAPPEVADLAQTPAPNVYRPVRATNVLYDLQDDGTVYLSDNTPARRVRYRYVDTYTWKNPATNASLKWTVPRDEVRVIPASLH